MSTFNVCFVEKLEKNIYLGYIARNKALFFFNQKFLIHVFFLISP